MDLHHRRCKRNSFSFPMVKAICPLERSRCKGCLPKGDFDLRFWLCECSLKFSFCWERQAARILPVPCSGNKKGTEEVSGPPLLNFPPCGHNERRSRGLLHVRNALPGGACTLGWCHLPVLLPLKQGQNRGVCSAYQPLPASQHSFPALC